MEGTSGTATGEGMVTIWCWTRGMSVMMGGVDLLRLGFFHDFVFASTLGRELVCIAAMFALLVASPRGFRTETREPVR